MRSRYVISLADQIFLSAFGFLLSFLLIRVWTPDVYGMYAFWQAISILVLGVQNALVNVLLNVYVPAARSEDERVSTERTLSTVNVLVLVAAFMLVVLLGQLQLTDTENKNTLSLVLGFFVGAGLLREFIRCVSFGRQRVGHAVWIDFFYILPASAILAIYAVDSDRVNVSLVFGVLGAASLISAMAGFMIEKSRAMVPYKRISFEHYRPFWKEAKWALMGTVSGDLLGRGYIYLVTALAGPAALGVLAAGRILFGPIPLVLRAWARIARPHMAEAASKGQPEEVLRTLLWALALVITAQVIVLFLIYALWTPLEEIVYRGRYEGIGFIVAGWAVVVVVNGVRSVVTAALHALKLFKPQATAIVYGGVISTVLVALIIPLLGYKLVFLGVLAGDIVALIYITYVFIKEIRFLFKKNNTFIIKP